MSYELSGGLVALYLSPALRGAKDSLREPIEKLLRSPVTLRVASQQVSDRGIVNALAGVRTERGEQALVLIESDYLYERTPVPPQSVWTQGGEREEHRQCLLALMRSGVKVREDQMGSALQHVNMIIAEGKNGLNAALLTSANLAPGSLDKHFNWGLSISDAAVCAALSAAFGEAWDGDFREVQLDYTKTFDGAEYLQVCGGAQGQAVDLAVKAIESAQDTIRFAYFNIARDSRVSRALANAINLSLSGSACSSGGSPGSLRVSSVAGKTGRV